MPAAAAKSVEVPTPGPADETIEKIAIADIKVADRLRPVSDAHVQWFVADMWRNGQLQPIEVCREGKGYRLVDGAHRLPAADRLGWTKINAIVRDHETLGRKQREISANLVRHELSPLDRAAFVGEQYQLMLVEKGINLGDHKQKMGGLAFSARLKAEAGEAGEMISSAYDLQDQIADQVGLTKRTIQNDIALYRGLEPEIVAQLRETPIGTKTTQLLRLAKMPAKERKAVVAALVKGTAKSVSEAETLVGGGRAERPAEAKLKVALNAFERLGMAERAQFLTAIATRQLPKGFAVTAPKKGTQA